MKTGNLHMASQPISTALAARPVWPGGPGDSTIVHMTSSRFFGGPERQMLELARETVHTWRTIFALFSEGGLCRSFLGEVEKNDFSGFELTRQESHPWANFLGSVVHCRDQALRSTANVD